MRSKTIPDENLLKNKSKQSQNQQEKFQFSFFVTEKESKKSKMSCYRRFSRQLMELES